MERYEIHPINPNNRFILKAVESLNKGDLISYPTGVNYGIGCAISSAQGVRTLNALTERLGRNRLHTIICKDISDVSKYAFVDNKVFKIMKRSFPGPYTFILEATPLVPKICQTRRKTIAVADAKEKTNFLPLSADKVLAIWNISEKRKPSFLRRFLQKFF